MMSMQKAPREQYMMRVLDWLDYLRSRGRRETTLDGYETKIHRCLSILDHGGHTTDPMNIGDVEVNYLKNTMDLSENSLKTYLKTLGYYCKWCTGKDPVEACDLLWNRNQINRVYISERDFQAMLSVSDERERLILLLGARMGLRRMEIAGLNYDDIKGDRMTIRGKGHGTYGKVVVMKIPPAVERALNDWNYARKSINRKDCSDGAIIVGFGMQGQMQRISLSAISHMVSEIGDRINVQATTHSLRRLFATTLHEDGVDLFDIKTLMRHDNVNTTINCYIGPNVSRLDAIMDTFV